MDVEKLSLGADEEMDGADVVMETQKSKKKKKKIASQITDGPAMRTRKSMA